MAPRRHRNWPSIKGSQDERATVAFQRLEDLTRLISDWVWETEADGIISYVSDRITDRLGLTPGDVVGRNFHDFGSFSGRYSENKSAPNLKRPFRDVGFDASTPDGRVRHFNISGLPRFDDQSGKFLGATGIARDVTDLVRVERANSRLADAIEVLPEYFALYDEFDRLIISNARFREMNKQFGEYALPGGKFEDLLRAQVKSGRFPEANSDEETWMQRRLARRKSRQGAFEVPIAGSRVLHIAEEKLPDGGTVMMSRDITDMKKALETLRSSAVQHREFASSTAHKLRTPLAVLRSNLDRLGASEEVAGLKREVDSLARMVEQLLTLTRYENFVVAHGDLADLSTVSVGVVSSLAPLAIKEGRILDLEGAEEPIVITGDQGALEHALRNLVENAIKYSSRGSAVSIKLEMTPPTIRVVDQGRGIPMENRAELFERFSRTDRRGAGAGLGLNIVKAVADSHNAEVAIQDHPEGGTVVMLRFPELEQAVRNKAGIRS